jgi:hypothetical protein
MRPLRQMIEQARQSAVVAVNSELTLLYWRVGQHIRSDVLSDARAEYGQEILPTLSAEIVPQCSATNARSVPAKNSTGDTASTLEITKKRN